MPLRYKILYDENAVNEFFASVDAHIIKFIVIRYVKDDKTYHEIHIVWAENSKKNKKEFRGGHLNTRDSHTE